MLDIGFWELAIVGIIALLVVKPDRFPEVIRTAGRWFGKAQHFVHSTRSEFNQEIQKFNDESNPVNELKSQVGEIQSIAEQEPTKKEPTDQ